MLNSIAIDWLVKEGKAIKVSAGNYAYQFITFQLK